MFEICEDLKRSLYLEYEAFAFLRSIYSVTNEHLSNIKCRLNISNAFLISEINLMKLMNVDCQTTYQNIIKSVNDIFIIDDIFRMKICLDIYALSK